MKLDSNKIRRIIIESSYKAGACHIGSALSCVDILVDIFEKMKKGDKFIFSKASGVSALYAVLALKGYFPENKVAYYLKKYPLPDKRVAGVLISGGSLGHGLPIACGLALVEKNDVYVLMSDAECNEGTTYESALFAKQHKLNNLYVFVDNNKFQACGKTEDILELTTAFDFLQKTLSHCSIVDTIKGKGVSFCEGNNDWHYRNLSKSERDKALKELK